MSNNEYSIFSPAYGKVENISKIGSYKRIAIFLPLYANHNQFSPVDGLVTRTRYVDGKFAVAKFIKKSSANERMEITIKTSFGFVKVFQIAGIIARSIVTNVKEGDLLKRRQKIGRINFGSRVDLYLPEEINVLVKKRDWVKGGKTIVARLTQEE